MAEKKLEHYSYKFKFNIDKLPAVKTDRIPFKITVWGLVFGFLLALIGGYEIISYFLAGGEVEDYNFNLPTKFSDSDILMQRYTFDTFILLFGAFIVTLSVLAMTCYKTIYFDGDQIIITHKPLFGTEKAETEKLYNYIGVLLKVEYYQLGLINRNRYIIELYHKSESKRIPLYISTNGSNVRKIWEQYAAKLRMPALFMTDHGLVSRHHNELNKTLKDMAKRWHLNALFREEDYVPSSVKYRAKEDKVILKERRLFFDIYTLLAIIGVTVLGFLIVYAFMNIEFILPYIGIKWFSVVLAVFGLAAICALIIIFSKDVLIITKDNVILGHNVLFLRMNAVNMGRNDIEAVDVGHNPITDRYYLSIISHDKQMVFGKNMPIDDLRWIRGLIIREIVK